MPYTTESPSPVPRAPLVVKNGIEGAAPHLGRHPDAGVADKALDSGVQVVPVVVLRLDGAHAEGERPAAGHRVHRVEEEVQEHLAKLRRVAADGRGRLQGERHVDEGAARLCLVLPARPGDLHDLLQQRRDLDRLHLLLALRSREPEDPAHRLRSVQRRSLDDLEALHDEGIRRPPLEQLGPPEDRREKVVEVVRDAARHLPQSAELRRLDGLLLRGLELRIGGPEVRVQLRVADRDRGLLGHRAGEPDLLGAELVLVPDADSEDAPDVLAQDDRRGEHRADPLRLEQGERVAASDEPRVGRQVRGPHRRPHERHVPAEFLPGLQGQRRIAIGRQSLGSEVVQRVAVPAQDAHRIRPHGLGHALHHEVQHSVEIERRGHRSPDLRQCLRARPMSLRLGQQRLGLAEEPARSGWRCPPRGRCWPRRWSAANVKSRCRWPIRTMAPSPWPFDRIGISRTPPTVIPSGTRSRYGARSVASLSSRGWRARSAWPLCPSSVAQRDRVRRVARSESAMRDEDQMVSRLVEQPNPARREIEERHQAVEDGLEALPQVQ